MEPLSDSQYRAATTGGMPDAEQVADGLWSLAMPMPGGGSLGYTLAAVHLGPDGTVALIDPGWAEPGSLERIDDFLRGLGRQMADVATVVVTHAHPDHIGLADAVRQASGARVVLHRREQASIDAEGAVVPEDLDSRLQEWGVAPERARLLHDRAHGSAPRHAPLHADVLVEDGDELPVAGATWRVLHTPGHTPGHICVVDESRGLLFSGDHVLPTVYPGLGLGADFGENPLTAYLRSLHRLHPYDDVEVVPGHGYRFRGLAGRRRDTALHALRRVRETAEVLHDDPTASIWDIASRLSWSGGWAQLQHSIMLFSGLNQTDMYRDFVVSGGLESPEALWP
ncbi:MBL fold metallo-hydrolase [Microbacterium protaetiae]|nr:MBL fold metallo-hydrolase [Microbacterium protaetiae]